MRIPVSRPHITTTSTNQPHTPKEHVANTKFSLESNTNTMTNTHRNREQEQERKTSKKQNER